MSEFLSCFFFSLSLVSTKGKCAYKVTINPEEGETVRMRLTAVRVSVSCLFLKVARGKGRGRRSVEAEPRVAQLPRIIGVHAPSEVQRAARRAQHRGKRAARRISLELACAAVRN